MIRQLILSAVTIAAGASIAVSQVVVLNSPAPWLTLRNDSVVAKAQIDTALNKSKVIKYTLSSVIGGTTKVIAKKDVNVTDVANDAFITKVNSSVLGGLDYLKIEWAADSQKAEILPFGILALEKLSKTTLVQIRSVDSTASLKAIADGIKDADFVKNGSHSYALVWNSKALYMIAKKSTDTTILTFAIDGKNGKNAFVAYPDRFVMIKQDSVWGIHYERKFIDSKIKYVEKQWHNEIYKEIVDDKIIVALPWFDSGIVPFEGRQAGFAVFVKKGDGIVASVPDKAQYYIPGTWGNFELSK
ncbi:MAG: hypothetical protein GX639_10465 [Fibrobacter sp.]|nr:hypothetical protein [Fibrobacter sp.]